MQLHSFVLQRNNLLRTASGLQHILNGMDTSIAIGVHSRIPLAAKRPLASPRWPKDGHQGSAKARKRVWWKRSADLLPFTRSTRWEQRLRRSRVWRQLDQERALTRSLVPESTCRVRLQVKRAKFRALVRLRLTSGSTVHRRSQCSAGWSESCNVERSSDLRSPEERLP